MKKQNSLWKKIKWWFNFLTSILMNSVIVVLILVGILVALYYVDNTFMKRTKDGWRARLYGAYVIVSTSMEPIIHVKDAIVIRRVDEPKIGDVCTYLSKDPRWPGIMITHRIIGIDVDDDGKKVYIFKGDANNVADTMPVSYNQIYGKVVMKIPKIGFVQSFLAQSYGWIICIVVPCVGLITFDAIKLVLTIRQKRRLKRGAKA